MHFGQRNKKNLPHTLLPFCKFVSSQLDASDRPNALKKENIFMIPSCGEKQGGNPEQLPHWKQNQDFFLIFLAISKEPS